MSSIVMDGKDGNGLKLEKTVAIFFTDLSCDEEKCKTLLRFGLPAKFHFISSS